LNKQAGMRVFIGLRSHAPCSGLRGFRSIARLEGDITVRLLYIRISESPPSVDWGGVERVWFLWQIPSADTHVMRIRTPFHSVLFACLVGQGQT